MVYAGQLYSSPSEALAFSALASKGEAHLMHYGVKGMKWGVRKNDQPTSTKLGSSEAAPVIALGALYAAIVLGAEVAKVKDSGKFNQMKTKNTEWKTKPSLAHKKSIDDIHNDVVKPINENYGARGTKMNCRRCTFAFEMRRRGLDVKATNSNWATGQDTTGLQRATNSLRKPYESVWGEKLIGPPNGMGKQTAQAKSDLIFGELGKQPNGARGEIAVGWPFGGGHSMAYEIVNSKPVIFDTQNSQTYRDSKAFSQFTPMVNTAAHTRLDNVDLDDGFMRKWVKNA